MKDSIITKNDATHSKNQLKKMVQTPNHRARTAGRVLKYGTKSLARNAWLTIAAIAIMTITLLILSVTIIATSAMRTVIANITEQVDMSIYIKQSATQDEINDIVARIKNLASVTDVVFTSPEAANQEAINKLIKEENISDQDIIDAMYEAPNKLPWTINVKIVDLNDPSELENFVYHDASMEGMLDAKAPSFSSSHRETINNIASTMRGIEIGGLIAAGVFAVIAILVVFNTIRMAIFNRKEEIYMMKLVGASKGFIRGPFIVESMLYGLISASITCALIYAAASLLNGRFDGALGPTVAIMYQYWYLVFAALLASGVLIGVFSSLLATHKYLKMR